MDVVEFGCKEVCVLVDEFGEVYGSLVVKYWIRSFIRVYFMGSGELSKVLKLSI